MHHPIHHIKKMVHTLKNSPIHEHKHWPLGPILFYLFGVIFILAFVLISDERRFIFLIAGIICLAFGYVLAEILISMIEHTGIRHS